MDVGDPMTGDLVSALPLLLFFFFFRVALDDN